MKKALIIMASTGGVAFLAVALIGYLAFAAFSEQSESQEAIDSALSNVQRINNRPVAPIMESVSAIEANTATLEKWYNEALQLVAVGDYLTDQALTPSSFKEKLVEESAALSKLPGNVLGSIVKEGYAFGFDRFITGSDLPEAEKIPEYDRQWNDIKVIVGALSKSGGSEFVSIEMKSVPDILKSIGIDVGADDAKAKKDDKKGGRANQRGNNKKAEDNKPAESYSMQGYHIVYRARPQAQVKFLNELASCSRFVTTFNLSFKHVEDPIATVFAPEKKAADTSSSKKRGRGKKRAEAEETAVADEAAAKAPSGMIIDTVNGGELEITLDLATIDFKTKVVAPEVKEEK